MAQKLSQGPEAMAGGARPLLPLRHLLGHMGPYRRSTCCGPVPLQMGLHGPKGASGLEGPGPTCLVPPPKHTISPRGKKTASGPGGGGHITPLPPHLSLGCPSLGQPPTKDAQTYLFLEQHLCWGIRLIRARFAGRDGERGAVRWLVGLRGTHALPCPSNASPVTITYHKPK